MSDTYHVRDWVRRNFASRGEVQRKWRPPEVIDRSDRATDPPMRDFFPTIAAELSAQYPDEFAYAHALRNYRLNRSRDLLTEVQRKRMRRIEIERSMWDQMSG